MWDVGRKQKCIKTFRPETWTCKTLAWVHNIKTALKEVRWGSVDWITMAGDGQAQVSGSSTRGNKLWASTEFREFLEQLRDIMVSPFSLFTHLCT